MTAKRLKRPLSGEKRDRGKSMKMSSEHSACSRKPNGKRPLYRLVYLYRRGIVCEENTNKGGNTKIFVPLFISDLVSKGMDIFFICQKVLRRVFV